MIAELIERAPKVLLHDHLDGGVRPATVVELAAEYGYDGLPTTDVDDLATWFNRGAKRNDLVLYLETFAHTVGVMQHKDAIERVAYECAQDLANDGVVYAEVRMAPELCIDAGLTLQEVLDAILSGFARGAPSTDLTIYTICSAMRTAALSRDIAELAVANRDRGVVGFDTPVPRRGTRRRVTSTRSSTSCARTSIPPSTPAKHSGSRRSGKRSSTAAPPDSATASVSSMTSPAPRRGAVGPTRIVRARPPGVPRAVPDVERQHRRVLVDRRASDRGAATAPLSGDGQHRQPADE